VALTDFIRNIPDFPKPGIQFKDISPLLQNPKAFKEAIGLMAEPYRANPVDFVVGIESRGFIFGVPLACELGVGFILIRKPGKLPSETISATYELEYGTDEIQIHKDAIQPGQSVALVDDLLATGGTMAAACRLVAQLGGNIQGISFLIELAFLEGRNRLPGQDIHTLVTY
jgi:adenine phosphoribosyltransferase